MRSDKKLDHLIDWVGADRVWEFILAACFPNEVQISFHDRITDAVETIEDEAREREEQEAI